MYRNDHDRANVPLLWYVYRVELAVVSTVEPLVAHNLDATSHGQL